MPDYPHLAICQSSQQSPQFCHHHGSMAPWHNNTIVNISKYVVHIASFHFFCSFVLIKDFPILNEFSKYDVSHLIDLIRHYHKYYVEHLFHGKYQFRLNVYFYNSFFPVLSIQVGGPCDHPQHWLGSPPSSRC